MSELHPEVAEGRDLATARGAVDLFDSTYSNWEAEVMARVRSRTFGEDFGQNSWTTAAEYERWVRWLEVDSSSHVLEVASGSGGPAIFLAQKCGARVTGIDVNEHAINTATRMAAQHGMAARLKFQQADADRPLPFDDASFSALLCVDSANHFVDRFAVLREWHRVLQPGARAVFTDPVVVTGLVSSDDIALRSSIGRFVFAPAVVNEQAIASAGLQLKHVEDVSDNAAEVAGRWHEARAHDRDALCEIEGPERFDGLQHFFDAVHRLTRERRLSRLAYLLQKPA